MDICTKGVGEGQNLRFFFFKRLMFREMGRTSNGPKIRNKISCTVKPRFTDTRLIRTPRYYGQFCWSRRKPYTFSLKLTRLIRTLVNMDNGHFSVSRVTNCYTLSTPLYGHCLSVHCQFSWSRLFANFTLVK